MLKAGIAICTFLIIAAGRFVCYHITHGMPSFQAAALAVYYALPSGFMGAFLFDLILARGRLRRKILCIRVLLGYYLLIYLAQQLLPSLSAGRLIVPIGSAASLILGILLIAADSRLPGKPATVTGGAGNDRLPASYTRRHPLKTLLETLFRLLPYPAPTALYRVGQAAHDSPVFVTGNYDLTVRRVAVALQNSACWMLVCDSRGINVWCSSLAGHFGSDDVIRAVERTGLADRVSHRRLVLPQLCASNVSPERILERTGFRASFGPVSIRHALTIMRDPGQTAYRRVTFDPAHRVEMALGSPLILCALLLLIFNFFGFAPLLTILPFLYGYSVAHGLLFVNPPMRSVGLWALTVGAAVFGVQILFALGPGLGTPVTALVTALAMAYLVTELSGWSPLVKYNLMPHGRKHIELNRNLCTGCGRCREVCPKPVFDRHDGMVAIVRADECILCRSCVFQCPVDTLALVGARKPNIAARCNNLSVEEQLDYRHGDLRL